jgi:hypothetical protein
MSDAGVTAFVCVTCKTPDAEPRGRLLFDAVSASLRAGSADAVTVTLSSASPFARDRAQLLYPGVTSGPVSPEILIMTGMPRTSSRRL